MNYPLLLKLLGQLIGSMALLLAPSLAMGLFDGEPKAWISFGAPILVCAALGATLFAIGRKAKLELYRREGIALVAIAWFSIGLLGGLPYWLAGVTPHFVSAFFESVSGFTTTGSTIFGDIEALPRSILLWRSVTHWFGGMGIILLFIAILPTLGVGGRFLMMSEAPGPINESLKPRISQTAKILWGMYIGLTVAECLILKLLGMSLFDAVNHAMATMATGGFSTKNASIAHYNSPAIEMAVMCFMLSAGVNFGLYYLILNGKAKKILKDAEFRFYLGAIALSTLAIAIWILPSKESLLESLRYSAFQVVAIITTTGFGTDDFNLYPPAAKLLLLLLMFVGGSAGSTAGGIKIFRVLVVFKMVYFEIRRVFQPQRIVSIKIGGKPFSDELVGNIASFVLLFLMLWAAASVLVAAQGYDIITSATSVAATLGNIGPGLARVGSIENFGFMTPFTQGILSVCMLLGRLELFTFLALFVPAFWRK